KKYPVFLYNREQIYDLFEHYEKMKARNNEYDSMDRTLAILRYAEKKALGSLHIHEVYIDECQDNHIVDLALILKVFDRASSIFLAGDIAQCIAKGSSFRFQDLKDLMYKWEHTRVPTKNHNVIKPKQFHLDINYRSHDGILQLAASVVDLIHHFFPNSIDKLPRERAEIGGPLPIIFDGFQKEYFKIFSTTDKDQNSFIEFGAYQVIIVRDDDAKSRLKKLIGRGAMVMTVYDAKGMEFNDVLLYNFFTDSPALRKVLYHILIILSRVKSFFNYYFLF
ncbi:tetratricopeptide repeat and ankyrin repeat containing 1, partial [Rhizophagus irregularis]